MCVCVCAIAGLGDVDPNRIYRKINTVPVIARAILKTRPLSDCEREIPRVHVRWGQALGNN